MEGVGIELLDGDGAAVGELGLVDEAEAAVAYDEIGGEILGGLDDLFHGDLERGIDGKAFVDGNGGEGGGGRVADGSGVAGAGRFAFGALPEEVDAGEDYGYGEEAACSRKNGLEGFLHGH